MLNICIKKNFETDIENVFKKRLLDLNVQFDEKKSCFFQYMNLVNRYISCTPRSVFESKSFIVPDKLKKNFEVLKHKLIHGENVNHYQSKQINNASYGDSLFSFEDLVHFHLGRNLVLDKKSKNYYVERTSDLAIALVKDDQVIFLKVLPHGKSTWVNSEYLEILDREFPSAILDRKINMIKGDNFDSELIDELRQSRKNYCIQTQSGNVYSNKPVMCSNQEIRLGDVLKKTALKQDVEVCYEKIKNEINTVGNYEVILKDITETQDGYGLKFILRQDQKTIRVIYTKRNKENEIIYIEMK